MPLHHALFAIALGCAVARPCEAQKPDQPSANETTSLDRELLAVQRALEEGRYSEALYGIDRIWDDVAESGSIHWMVVLCQWRADSFRALGQPLRERDALRDAIGQLGALPADDAFVMTGASGFRILLARCLQRIEDYDGAERAAREALDWAGREGAPAGDRGIALNWIGVAQMYSGRPAVAWETFRDALDALPEDHPSRPAMLSSMGICAMLLGDRKRSLSIHDDVVARIDSGSTIDADTVATALHNRAFLLTDMGLYARAERDLRRALATHVEDGNVTDSSPAEIHGLLSNVLRNLGRYDAAIEHARTSVRLQEQRYGPDHPKLLLGLTCEARAVSDLGAARADPELLDAAERLFDEALRIAEQHDTLFRQDVFAFRGEFFRSVRHDPARAAADFRESIRIIEQLRSRSPALEGPMAIGRYFIQLRRYDPYTQLSLCLLELRREADALRTVEAARARALVDLLNGDGTAPPPGGVLEPDAGGPASDAARTSSFAAGPTAAADVRAALRPGEAIVYYLLTATDSYALFAAHDGEVVAYALRDGDRRVGADQLDALVDGYRSTFLVEPSAPDRGRPSRRQRADTDPESAAARGQHLFRILVPEPLWTRIRGLRAVHVVPHGALHRLPFESLVTAVDADTGHAAYWLDDGPLVAYAASGSVIVWSRDRREAQRQARLAAGGTGSNAAIVLADPVPGPEHDEAARALPPLPGARREGRSIADSLDGRIDVRVLEGEQARERELRAALRSARFLHLATHQLPGVVGGERTGRLVLARGDGDDDGYLDLDDLLRDWRGRLDACELVVLSSCASGVGEPLSDEGMVALPWGIQAAGCPYVVASLWPVHDRATADLMSAFYGSIGRDPNGSRLEFLHQARQLVRKTRESPYFWAPFVWIGAAD